MSKELVKLRGHHLEILRIFDGFEVGGGRVREYFEKYGEDWDGALVKAFMMRGEEFYTNALKVLRRIKGGNPILVTDRIDEICQRCPQKETVGCSQAEVPEVDREVAQHYEVKLGEAYSLDDLLERLRTKKRHN